MRASLLGIGQYYETYGDAPGDPAVFLHGFSQSLATWYPVRDALAAATGDALPQLVLLDLIGHGSSDKPESAEPYRLGHIVDALEALRALLGARRLHLVGYSMGGRIALSYAAKHPDAVASLLLESSSFGPRDAAEKAAALDNDRALAERLRASSPDEFAEWWAATPVLSSQADLPPELQEAEAAMRRANDMSALAHITLGAGQGQMPDLLGVALGLHAPVTYVCGMKDEKYSRIARAALVRGLDVRLLPTGHNVHLEQPVEYAHLLQELWGRAAADNGEGAAS